MNIIKQLAPEVVYMPMSVRFMRHEIIDCVNSLGRSEHSDVTDSVVAPTTAEIQ